ncbi:STAS-like domain-containing protein [Vibrio fluvialis]|uniref:STAS-like domain-containing protein n=1 Tax=Vibrio fluvialis TaxID=676 RepID=UPI00192C95F5|nr:STAS-like domain-containing protein [Vibrio fluvialis]EHU4932356.1 STAS-like domain-containing protein [Vibrio vulnificus]EIZ1457832.1 STAS-like domain-containing protein [Vibrio vulnificus]EJE8569853.1 STAS-like domain-containing protein [Vibrio vulnificus]EKA7349913.1 STAS-like domain-containing protein [Vibrio vulnificus]ELP6734487.1 STAS-like domain-containing protein [Vibrio vulnificus]
MKHKEIVMAKDFSEFPFGRRKADGTKTAEHFIELLSPALKEYDVVTVVLDGVFGFGSSFLEEAFGGLVKKGFSKSELKSSLNIVSEDEEYLISEIWGYIENRFSNEDQAG